MSEENVFKMILKICWHDFIFVIHTLRSGYRFLIKGTIWQKGLIQLAGILLSEAEKEEKFMGKISKTDVSRITSTQAKKTGGQIQKNSFAARIQSSSDKRTSNKSQKKQGE
jgi:hypothetical protein